jgi:hypothetical protein
MQASALGPQASQTVSGNALALPAAADAVTMQEAAMSAVHRLSAQFLLPIFNDYKDASNDGITNPSSLRQALERAGAPCIPLDEALGDYFQRFDVFGVGCVTFDSFKRAVEVPDVLESWLDEGKSFNMGALAPALRIAACSASCDHDESLSVLKAMSNVDDATIDLAVDCSVAALKKRLKAKRDELIQVFHLKERADAVESSKAEGDRLIVAKMMAGNAVDFFDGLEARVGFPSLDFEHAMFLEHCKRGGADFEFDSGHPYNIKSSPSLEWKYVLHAHVADFQGNLHVAPEVVHNGRRQRRVIRRIDELLEQHQRAKLSRAEVIAVILYSGPMFVIYNGALRQFPPNVFNALKKNENLFSTTIFVLSSALQKLARVTRIFANVPLFRGLGGTGKFTLELPDSFLKPDAQTGCTGYMDYGFQSFTADEGTAIEYSGVKQHKPSACMLEIFPNSIDRAADISEFSQFPTEKEFTFVPCSFVQHNGDKKLKVVHWPSAAGEEVGYLTVVPARVNANLRTETIDQAQSRKKNLHIAAFKTTIDETKQWMQSYAEEGGRAQARAPTDDSYGEYGYSIFTFISNVLKKMEKAMQIDSMLPVDDYINDLKYKALVTRMLSSQAWAKQSLYLWLEDPKSRIQEVDGNSLKDVHRGYLMFLLQERRAVLGTGGSKLRTAALKILQCKGLMVTDNVSFEEADGEPLIYAAAADSWALDDLQV